MGKLARLIVQPQDVLYDLLGIFQPRVGQYYQGLRISAYPVTYSDAPADRLYAGYYVVFRKFRADRIATWVRGAGAIGARFRIGIYTDDNYYPDSLLVDSGELSAETVGVKEATIDLTLDTGRYWVAYLANDGTIDIPALSHFLTGHYHDAQMMYGRYAIAQTYGALPSTFPSGAGKGPYIIPVVDLRVAEVF